MKRDEEGLEISVHNLIDTLKRTGRDRLITAFYERTHDNNIVQVLVYEKSVTLEDLYGFADHFTDQSYRYAWEFYKTQTGLGVIARLL